MRKIKIFLLLTLLFLVHPFTNAQSNDLRVIAYYSGSADKLDDFQVEKLTHIIYCFGHLSGNELYIGKEGGAILSKMVQLKKRNKDLKVLMSLGGWGGCKTCSDVFAGQEARRQFASSVKSLLALYEADGIDLDWEYPGIEGFIGHNYDSSDKQHFTSLIRTLRDTLGNAYEISFAAGGFQSYMDSAVEWKEVMPLVNYVNLMSYDLVNGYATITGHHTPLYSTPEQVLSVDWGVRALTDRGVPKEKIVIGAAFYGRVWGNVADSNNGLYGQGKFIESHSIRKIDDLLDGKEYTYYWDDKAKAPYMYSNSKQLFITYDDKRSIGLKTQYAIDQQLGGIMFWQLGLDYTTGGLLNEIDKTKKSGKATK